MSWIRIESAADCERFLDSFGGFHDSCLREIHLWTKHFVDDELAMGVGPGLDTQARILFQRQFKNPSAIELLFQEIVSLQIEATPENYDSIIFDADLRCETDTLQFSADGVVNVTSRKVWWRDASAWMGPSMRYGEAATPTPQG